MFKHSISKNSIANGGCYYMSITSFYFSFLCLLEGTTLIGRSTKTFETLVTSPNKKHIGVSISFSLPKTKSQKWFVLNHHLYFMHMKVQWFSKAIWDKRCRAIGNSMGTHWEHRKQKTTPNPKEKKLGPLECMLSFLINNMKIVTLNCFVTIFNVQ
jgi:hypothetical protein